MPDTHPNQADGTGSAPGKDGVNSGGGASGAGESGGGARAGNQDPGGRTGGPMGHGGQSEIGYHGPGQLGEEKVEDAAQPNSATGAA